MEKIERQIVNGGTLSREQVQEMLANEIKCSYTFMAEVLGTEEVQKAIGDILWQRYEKMLKQNEIEDALKAERNG